MPHNKSEYERYKLAKVCKRNAKHARHNEKIAREPEMKEYWRKVVIYWNIRAKGQAAVPPQVPEQYK